jgi:hypothetical protein
MTALNPTDIITPIDASCHSTRYDDNILVLFYQFIHGIYEGKVLSKSEFEMFEQGTRGIIVNANFKGCWLIVGNSYHATDLPTQEALPL